MIKTEQFKDSPAEKEALTQLVDNFAIKMKELLMQKYDEGKHGWDDKYNKDPILWHLESKVKDLSIDDSNDLEDYIDIANFAAMLWNMKQPN